MAKILIVEDSPVDQRLIQRLLVRPGWVTQLAGNGNEALELIGKVRPDIVITDLQMPEICLLYTSPSPRDQRGSRMPSSA